ncbi:MAG: bifunctional phosphoglucose/phosphomannose isomerase [Candidatus Thermoplasmatota archaeon]|jgi:glucose/mannose-6-phosphate isomerase|nr:bifunctional phosphoglucose/phosphomannose isomerase [Candidatus Thermoplasmatota archaeon]MCL5793520.1 bifunctional phosphoglucose/phosphomannose isomerase [Candidatus Thermoplasmatota archaeon]
MIEELRSLAGQITFKQKLDVFPNDNDFDRILIFGMGASGLVGNIFQEIYSDMPVITVNDRNVPNFVNGTTLAIGISYSGNTVETVDALAECARNGAHIRTITSGGILGSESYNPLIVPAGLQPRSSLGYLLIPLFRTFMSFGNSDYNETRDILAAMDSNNSDIRKMAEALNEKGSIPFIYGFWPFRSIAYRWKTQFNENSKCLAYSGYFPEMAHNDIVALRRTFLRDKISFIAFDPVENRFVSERIKAISEITETDFTLIRPRGKSLLARLFYLIHFGDYLSYYLALERGIDPVDVSEITELKRRVKN